MRAVWLREFGGPEALVPGDAPDPVAGPGQVLVDVAFANITFVETQFRASGFGPFWAALPVIPGNGVGGVVTAVGEGASPELVGRRVVSCMGGSGGYAERAAVAADVLVEVPDGVPLDVAVALLADGRTATVPAPGRGRTGRASGCWSRRLAGGVGSLLVQLARTAGAVVVAAAGGPRKVVWRATPAPTWRWTTARRTGPLRVGTVDVVFDGVGGSIGRSAFELLGPGGRMVSYGLASGSWADVSDTSSLRNGTSRSYALGRLRRSRWP